MAERWLETFPYRHTPDSVLGLCDSQLHLHNERKKRRGQVGAGDSGREDRAVLFFPLLSPWKSAMEGQGCLPRTEARFL